MKCILCFEESESFFNDRKTNHRYFRCPSCDLHFLDPVHRLAAKDERHRYSLHRNDARDLHYQEFMRPMLELIRSNSLPRKSVLDFGCGVSSVLQHVLQNEGYQVSLYDPFFHAEQESLAKSYDFIAAVEVFEHLYEPGKELEKLHSLLNPGGSLGIMTLLLQPDMDFENWFYRRDPTHVCFCTAKTVTWIQHHFRFSLAHIHSSRLIEFLV